MKGSRTNEARPADECIVTMLNTRTCERGVKGCQTAHRTDNPTPKDVDRAHELAKLRDDADPRCPFNYRGYRCVRPKDHPLECVSEPVQRPANPTTFAEIPCSECGLVADAHPNHGNAGVERCKVRALMRELRQRSETAEPARDLATLAKHWSDGGWGAEDARQLLRRMLETETPPVKLRARDRCALAYLVTTKLLAARREIANPRRCARHGSQGCIDCEKRCECCGDNGSMGERHGQRLCENCVWDHDQGNFSCDCPAPDAKGEDGR